MSDQQAQLIMLANQINQQVQHIKRGTLRFWGEWFGRPYDNVHTIVEAAIQDGCLLLRFDAGETMLVCNPSGVRFTPDEFVIARASSVEWTWQYGPTKRGPSMLRYIVDGTEVRRQSADGRVYDKSPDPAAPAEIF